MMEINNIVHENVKLLQLHECYVCIYAVKISVCPCRGAEHTKLIYSNIGKCLIVCNVVANVTNKTGSLSAASRWGDVTNKRGYLVWHRNGDPLGIHLYKQ